ncbi:MAG: aldehyde dehydrogenase family protein, partial [Chloroflexi bacterium]|nr:aldehyde dehydrogenase family protein [Chloroflexota bacterium]
MAETQIKTHKNYIGGQWVESVTGRTYQVHNPAHTDQIIGEFQTSGADDALRAVAAAKEGLAVWAATPAPARASIIFKALEILGRRGDEMAQTITTEEGKPIADAHGEVKRSMNIMEYAAGEG